MGKERDWFDFDSIVDTLTSKLIRRHPHVFPDGDLKARFNGPKDEAAIKQQWEAIKEEERREKSHMRTLDDVPRALPALSRAQKLQKRAARVGFDWPDTEGVFAKVREELAELEEAVASKNTAHMQEEFGDLLFSLVNVARHLKIDSETAVSDCNRKFERRFNSVEDALQAQGKTPTDANLEQLDALWNQAKLAEKSAD
jgi:ATP diphosphatase